MQFVVLGMMEVKVCSMLRETLYEIASLYDIMLFNLLILTILISVVWLFSEQ